MEFKNSKLLRELSDKTGTPIGKLQSMWKEAESEAIKEIMWNPAKYTRYNKQTGTLYSLIEQLLLKKLGE